MDEALEKIGLYPDELVAVTELIEEMIDCKFPGWTEQETIDDYCIELVSNSLSGSSLGVFENIVGHYSIDMFLNRRVIKSEPIGENKFLSFVRYDGKIRFSWVDLLGVRNNATTCRAITLRRYPAYSDGKTHTFEVSEVTL